MSICCNTLHVDFCTDKCSCFHLKICFYRTKVAHRARHIIDKQLQLKSEYKVLKAMLSAEEIKALKLYKETKMKEHAARR